MVEYIHDQYICSCFIFLNALQFKNNYKCWLQNFQDPCLVMSCPYLRWIHFWVVQIGQVMEYCMLQVIKSNLFSPRTFFEIYSKELNFRLFIYMCLYLSISDAVLCTHSISVCSGEHVDNSPVRQRQATFDGGFMARLWCCWHEGKLNPNPTESHKTLL